MGRRRKELSVDAASIRSGLERVSHPGRLEWIGDSILIDGAHNAESASALANYIKGIVTPAGCTLLLGASIDKNVRSIATTLAPYVKAVVTTRCSHPRAMEPGVVAAQLVDLKMPVIPAGRVEEALRVAKSHGGVVVVAGSLFLAGAVRELCGR
jgi:dihydrofolate synthase/folylpolyglutamate synthase